MLDLDTWRASGALVVPGFLEGEELDQVRRWVDDIEAQPDGAHGIAQYDEVLAAGGSARCRSENILGFNPGIRELLTRGPLTEIAGELLGEPAVLYKEKINYKNPGGAGFAPHQDAPAYPFVTSTVTCMIALDDSTTGNGCLDIVPGLQHAPLPTDEAGCIPAELAATLAWQPVPYGPFPSSARMTRAGDVIAVPTPGHTPGHLSVLVNDGDRQIMLAGDTSYLDSTMLSGTVDGVSGDETVAQATLAGIRELCARPLVYLPSHDPKSAERLQERRAVTLPRHSSAAAMVRRLELQSA